MKRLFVLSITPILGLAACSENSKTTLKARQRSAPPQNIAGKVADEIASVPQSDLVKLTANTRARRNVLLDDDSSRLSVLCTDNLELALKERDRVKILGRSQILIRQDTEVDPPEQRAKKKDASQPAAALKDVLNVVCNASAAPTDHLEQDPNVALLILNPGAPVEVTGKFRPESEEAQKIMISCESPQDLVHADSFLMPESGEFPVKILMNPQGKMLFETNKDGNQKEYILVKCESVPTEKSVSE